MTKYTAIGIFEDTRQTTFEDVEVDHIDDIAHAATAARLRYLQVENGLLPDLELRDQDNLSISWIGFYERTSATVEQRGELDGWPHAYDCLPDESEN